MMAGIAFVDDGGKHRLTLSRRGSISIIGIYTLPPQAGTSQNEKDTRRDLHHPFIMIGIDTHKASAALQTANFPALYPALSSAT
jgi:hypothetical protein